MPNVKPQYQDLKSTPMKYFYFLQYVSLTLGMLINLAAIVSLFAQYGSLLPWFFVYSLAFRVIFFALNVIALIGCYKMQWRGVLALQGMFLLQALDSLISLILYASSGATDNISDITIRIVTVCVIVYINHVYFQKRRMFFEPKPLQL